MEALHSAESDGRRQSIDDEGRYRRARSTKGVVAPTDSVSYSFLSSVSLRLRPTGWGEEFEGARHARAEDRERAGPRGWMTIGGCGWLVMTGAVTGTTHAAEVSADRHRGWRSHLTDGGSDSKLTSSGTGIEKTSWPGFWLESSPSMGVRGLWSLTTSPAAAGSEGREEMLLSTTASTALPGRASAFSCCLSLSGDSRPMDGWIRCYHQKSGVAVTGVSLRRISSARMRQSGLSFGGDERRDDAAVDDLSPRGADGEGGDGM